MVFIRTAFYFTVTLSILALVAVEAGLINPRGMDSNRHSQKEPQKRPFCNAFTGCGRKRSGSMQRDMDVGQPETVMDDTLGDLIDLNSEPAVEDLMRQIMSQAKIWEAIQEASREIYGTKNGKIDEQNRFPISFNTQ